MADLLELRDKIDEIDRQIIQLFEERMDVSRQVADFKIRTGKPVFDREREADKLKRVKELAHTPFNATGTEELFQQIMSMSRKLQYQLLTEHGVEEEKTYSMVPELADKRARVVFQGVEGAYSHAAMREFFGDDIKSSHVQTWKDAMDCIAKGEADYAVLPIENSTAGIVAEIYDLLVDYNLYIVGEQIIKCEHNLLGLPEASAEDIQVVYSHPQALMQCKTFLEQHPQWDAREMGNTAVSAKKVKEDGDIHQGAIASRAAAEFYDLKILADDIYYNQHNSTRFIVVSAKQEYVYDANKISICFELPHKSGTLYNMLSHFIYNGLNMTKIESRPIPGRNWEYRFFVDFEGNLEQSAVKNALRGIRQEASQVRVFGNY